MTDITPGLNSLLRARDAHAAAAGTEYSLDNINDFLKEAYQINFRITDLLQHLRSIRRPYLSTAPPPRQTRFTANTTSRRASQQQQHLTNADRDSIDNEAKSMWRDISAHITRLAQAEKVRRTTEQALVDQRRRKKGLGALGAWAAGGATVQKSAEEEAEDGRISSIGAVRESVIWFLNRGLEECGRAQSSMMEIRISRELEKGKSVLSAQTRGSVLADVASGSSSTTSRQQQDAASRAAQLDNEAEQAMVQQLSQEQMQLFAEENKDMLKHYEDQLGKVRAAEKSLLEISELQATLANNLQTQSAHIEQLVQDSFQTTTDVTKGNVELKKATQRRSTAKLVFWSSIGLCTFLVGWDLFV